MENRWLIHFVPFAAAGRAAGSDAAMSFRATLKARMPVDLHLITILVAGSTPAGAQLRSSVVEQADPP